MGKLQDILSGLKSFAKSDTGKTLGMALGTIAAGRYGGAEGINALTSAIEKSRMKKKEEEREAERKQDLTETRDLRKVNMAKAELDLQHARQKMKYPERENRSDWELMNTRAVEPDETSAGVKAAVSKVKTDKEPKLPQPPQPTPVSINDPEAVQKGEIDAAQWAAKVIQKMDQLEIARVGTPLSGSGRAGFVENREFLNQELQGSGLTKEQQAAAWKEMTRLIMPGRYEQIQEEMAAAADPDYTWDEGGAKFQESAFKSAGTAGGAMLGASIGTGMLPGIGTVAGGLIGAGMGYAGSRALGDITFSGQADATSTPAVAGANKSAAEDMATYQDDTNYAVNIANNLMQQGLTNADVPAIMDQLSKIPEIADNKERRDKILKLIQQRFIANARMGGQWTNQRAWR